MLSLPEADDPRTYAISSAALEVHRVLGTGFLEIFYKDALEIEFTSRGVPFGRELPCNVNSRVANYAGNITSTSSATTKS